MFQKKIVEKYLSKLDSKILVEKYIKYCSIFANKQKQENIRNSKEEQYQEGFVRDLFCSVLGYTIKPEANYNILTELKNESKSNSKKSDAAIIISNQVKAVIELKGTDTQDLDKVAFQAFSYKNHHEKCNYVIVSNFERLRLYVETQIEYTEFNLFNLSKENFDLLYLLLSLDNITSDVPLKLKHETLTEEIEITNNFYTDYSAFKRALFEDLTKNNPDIDKLLLFKKTQKLLDRLLFVMFCEDRNLLPTNSTLGIINDYKKLKEMGYYQPLYNFFKVFFERIDKGFTHEVDHSKDIFAYNGGLFKPDEILDNIKIGDDVLLVHSPKLANYDFASQISVDILGRIFENSLTEIEEVQNEIENEKNGIKQKSSNIGKRKKDGVFYTPEYITKYIVENTIGKLCEEKKNELKINDSEFTFDKKYQKKKIEELDERLNKYRNWLLSLKILDCACGSGAFLNAALKELRKEHTLIDKFWAKIHRGELNFSQIDNTILENNLYGVDINDDSIEITKLSLWLHTATPNRKLTTLNDKIKCGNSLIDDASVAGEKAFVWEKEFPEVFTPFHKGGCHEVTGGFSENGKLNDESKEIRTKRQEDCFSDTLSQNRHCETASITSSRSVATSQLKGGFDVVIGNPPYGAKFSKNEITYFEKNYKYQSYQMDSYLLFVEKIGQLLKPNGYLGLIMPNTWLSTIFSTNIRKYVFENYLMKQLRHYQYFVFPEATVETDVYILIKDKNVCNNDIEIAFIKNDKDIFPNTKIVSQSEIIAKNGLPINIYESKDFETIKNKCNRLKRLGDLFQIVQGAKPFQKGKGKPPQTEEILKSQIFIQEFKKDETYVPCLRGSLINRYANFWNDNYYISYGDWLAEPRYSAKFDSKEKLLIRQTGDSIIATYDNKQFIARDNLYVLRDDEKKNSLNTLLSILNSKFITWYYQNFINPEVGKTLAQVKRAHLLQLPIPDISKEMDRHGAKAPRDDGYNSNMVFDNKNNKNQLQQKLIPSINSQLSELAEKMLSLNEDLQKKTTRFISRIKETYAFEKTTQNIENFYKLTFTDFVKELSKVKVKLTMKQKDELEDYFNDYVKDISALNASIEATDNEINKLVYKLYNLTDEEIKIIAG